MKLNFAHNILGIILCSALLGVAQTAHASKCTISNVAGKYGYTSTGTIVNPAVGPFTAVGRIELTETGTLSGAQTASIAGNFADETFEGTFTVNPDCTGTATVYVYRGGTLVRTSLLLLVWDDRRREARGVFLTAGTNISINGRKMFGDDED